MSEGNGVPRDQVFATEKAEIPDFKFNSEVANVFDDMVSRSVPFYGEMQRMSAELAGDYMVAGTNVYDLGCSTGTSMLLYGANAPKGTRFIGIDDSQDMLDKCRQKMTAAGFEHELELRVADLNEGAQVARGAVHGFHDEVGFAVEFDYLAFADVVGGGHVDVMRRGFRVVERLSG